MPARSRTVDANSLSGTRFQRESAATFFSLRFFCPARRQFANSTAAKKSHFQFEMKETTWREILRQTRPPSAWDIDLTQREFLPCSDYGRNPWDVRGLTSFAPPLLPSL